MTKHLVVSAEKTHKLVFKLAQLINEKISTGKLEKPNFLVVIGRGGMTWAKELADWLNIAKVSSFQVLHYRGIGQRLKEPIILQPLPISVENQTVLLFDDVVESGKTLKLGINLLKMMGVKKVITATLFYKGWSDVKPDFFVIQTKAWVIFHNETMETVKSLGADWLKKGLTLSKIRKNFLKIGLGKKEVDYALKTLFNFPS